MLTVWLTVLTESLCQTVKNLGRFIRRPRYSLDQSHQSQLTVSTSQNSFSRDIGKLSTVSKYRLMT
jgi:hypothetical protein